MLDSTYINRILFYLDLLTCFWFFKCWDNQCFITYRSKIKRFHWSIAQFQYFPSYCTLQKRNQIACKPACNKRNRSTTLKYRTKQCIALSLVKPGELTLRVRSPDLTSFVQYTSSFCTFV